MNVLKIVALLVLLPAAAQARTILFISNSFTYGANSPAHYYRSDTVTDLNGPGRNGKSVGGVPAIFKAFTKEAGLDYDVSLETVGGKGMDFHYADENVSFYGHSRIALTLRRSHYGFVDCGVAGDNSEEVERKWAPLADEAEKIVSSFVLDAD